MIILDKETEVYGLPPSIKMRLDSKTATCSQCGNAFTKAHPTDTTCLRCEIELYAVKNNLNLENLTDYLG